MTSVRDPEHVRDLARRILERDEFAKENSLEERINDILDKPFDWLGDLFSRLFSAFFGGNGAPAALVAWVLVALTVVIVVLLCVKLVRNTSRNDAIAPAAIRHHEMSRADLLAEAEAHEANGEWRQAIRARHAALVASLADAGLVRRRPGTTAREYAMQLSTNAPRAYPTFDEATWLFEWAWYGTRQPGQAESLQFRELSERVRNEVRK